MSEAPYVVQKVEWFQFRAPDGEAFFVMVSSLPNGFHTAVPVQLGSPACPCRYSSATRPIAAAFTRSGMSLVTSVTSRPSAARPSATERIRASLDSACGGP